jgi:hypothetical protein
MSSSAEKGELSMRFGRLSLLLAVSFVFAGSGVAQARSRGNPYTCATRALRAKQLTLADLAARCGRNEAAIRAALRRGLPGTIRTLLGGLSGLERRLTAGGTSRSVRVNNLANLEALLNIIANGMEILGIAWGGPTMIMGFMHMAAGTQDAMKRVLFGAAGRTLGLKSIIDKYNETAKNAAGGAAASWDTLRQIIDKYNEARRSGRLQGILSVLVGTARAPSVFTQGVATFRKALREAATLVRRQNISWSYGFV